MATLQQVEAHATVVDDLTTVAIAELVQVWREFDLSDVRRTRGSLAELLDAIVGDYGQLAMEIAVDWYDTLRSFANVSERYNADGVELPSSERIQALAGWAAEPLSRREDFDDLLEPPETVLRPEDARLALSRASGGLQRVLANIDRDVTEANATRDPAEVRWARHASPTACAFCALLATRGPAYVSESTATTASGTRGAQIAGARYHDHCHCIAVPVWAGDEYEEAPYVEQWRDVYFEASAETGDVNKVLANMRQIAGLR